MKQVYVVCEADFESFEKKLNEVLKNIQEYAEIIDIKYAGIQQGHDHQQPGITALIIYEE